MSPASTGSTGSTGSLRSTGRDEGVPPFDVCGPLPEGTVVLEASAGTGKTFTIAALATRYVAEGHVELGRLMLVTFGRAATQELRERVRERLVATERELADADGARRSGDDLVRLLADADDDEVARRRRRLTTALAGFDAATIATTHGFCQQMLAGLGMASDNDPDATFVENLDDLIDEVTGDLYLRKFATPTAGPPELDHADARRVAREAVTDRHARLVPADADPASLPGLRHGIARAARDEVDRRKRQRRLIDYDDLLSRLRDALNAPENGEAARQRIRDRYDVVLVDEFQDTDPVQWDILRLTFHGHATLVLIGDPKQAIYGFRGGDVVTYLDAVGTATSTATLTRNWRSDQPLLDALEAVFGGAALGDERIVVRPVVAARPERRLQHGAPLRIRLLDRGDGPLSVGPARERVIADVASDIARRLTDGEVQPGDIAVLVRKNDQGRQVREALAGAGVPAVLAGSASVFGTPIAREWLTLLRGVEAPHRPGLVRAAALTCFLGWSAARLDELGERALDELGPRMRGWADLLARRGVAALLEEITASSRLPARMLGGLNGERDLTDLRHIGQTLHAEAVAGSLGVTALVEWLQRRIAEADTDPAEDRSRRLESDADAVQIVTVHRSKGLEFPVVYVPFAWDRWTPQTPDLMRLHDEDGSRILDVGGPQGPDYQSRKLRYAQEECGEDLRLFYVAVTRAQSSVVLHFAPSRYNTAGSALNRLLFAEFARESDPPPSIEVPSDRVARTLLGEIADASDGRIAVEPVDAEAPPARWEPPAAAVPTLSVATFDRQLDLAWRRTSYSALTAAVHDAGAASGPAAEPLLGSEPEEPERADERAVQQVERADSTDGTGAGPLADDLRAVRSPLADLPSGTAFGTLVHAVLENRRHVGPGPRHRAPRAVHGRGGVPLRQQRRPAGTGRGAAARPRHPARHARRRAAAARHHAAGPAPRDGLRDAARRRGPAAGHGGDPRRRGRATAPAPTSRRPADRLRGPARRTRLARATPPRLPHRQRRRGAAGEEPVRRAALPHRRLQDELARRGAGRRGRRGRRSRGAVGLALPPVGDGGGDAVRPLPAAGAALRRRGAPLPALASARLRPGAASRRRALPVRPRHVWAGHPRHGRHAVRRLQLAAAERARRGPVRAPRGPQPCDIICGDVGGASDGRPVWRRQHGP